MSAHDRVSPRVVIATATGATEPVPTSIVSGHRPLTRSRRLGRISPRHHRGRARPRDQERGPRAPDRPPTAPVGRRGPAGAGAAHGA